MIESSKDAGVILALAERFQKERLPRALALKERVDKGEVLSDLDIAFLEEVFQDARHIQPLLDQHPEWQALAGRAVHLYKEIMDKASENEAAAPSKKA